MGDMILSHVPDAICKSVRSKKKINEKCKNPAIHEGSFCGLHNKNPILWVPNIRSLGSGRTQKRAVMTEAGLKYKVNKKFDGDYFKLYEALAEGKPINMKLNPTDENVMFENTKTGIKTIETGKFKRLLCFNEETRKIIKEIKKQEKKKNYKNVLTLDGESI